MIDNLLLPWYVMAGNFEEGEACLAHVIRLSQQMATPQTEDAVAGAMITLRLWQGRADEVAPALMAFEGGPMPITSTLLVFLIRAGDLEAAKAHAAEYPMVLDAVDWFSMLNWASAAEASLWLAGPRDRRGRLREARAVRRSGGLVGLRKRQRAGRRVPGPRRGSGR